MPGECDAPEQPEGSTGAAANEQIAPRAQRARNRTHPFTYVYLPRVLLILAIILVAYAMPRSPHARATIESTWTQVPANGVQPPARTQYGMTADAGGNIYVYGGRGADGNALSDFWLFHPLNGSWQQLTGDVLPPLIEPHLAVDSAGNVFEFGGIGDPNKPHFSYDGHSFGLYEYIPAQAVWADLTPYDAQPDTDWPLGREDHGFTYDPISKRFYVFAGEGPLDITLNDMWSYNETNHIWNPVQQSYVAPNGAGIDPREIYNLSYDNHGGFYLFGGSYLTRPDNSPVQWTYVNDLWHFDLASFTWTLIAGTANSYDATMPLPRHYYGQACDADGNLYVLGGYLSDSNTPPYFNDDTYAQYAQPIHFGTSNATPGTGTYALSDFWQFNVFRYQWVDLSNELGSQGGLSSIPYVMVTDTADQMFISFGGFQSLGGGILAPSAEAWSYGLPQEAGVMPPPPTPTLIPTQPVPPTPTQGVTPSATPDPQATATESPQPGASPEIAGTPQVLPLRLPSHTTGNLLAVLEPGGLLFGADIAPDDLDNPPE